MSAKIYAFTHMVNNYEEKLSSFLHLPIKTDKKYWSCQLGDYDVYFMPDDPVVSCLSYTDAFAYFHYFEKDCNLRVECFDCVRALGLNEMWVFEELLYDALGKKDGYTLEEAIKDIEDSYKLQCREFVRDEVDEDNYGIFYHDSFTDLFKKVELLENKFNVKVLGLKWYIDPQTEEKLIRVLKNDKVYYMGQETGNLTEIQ